MGLLDRFKNKEERPYELTASIEGMSVNLSEVRDEVFSSGALGKGVGIVPSNGKVVAPISGKVSMIFPTKHALGIKTEAGVEVLIHIGVDTVELDGEGFDAKVAVDQKVKRGDLLVNVDFPLIEKHGFDTTVINVITNTNDFKDVETLTGEVTANDVVLKIVKE
ncbi:PTS sugar transporter subunit IIA [Breznakia pachnodae]|uniref:Glucose-specific phosphotransferase system IIA component n=1 Tax=Breznakia pachnodae TaxID=265178 RepID=A0ABU0E017_9FIRM|nr:PTS glucose transporter subunit IIA [Breznakia pachnodae]MDQ0360232.1 glucose-specific phosphotransferase system IIA component [Breznakia pachnodae]